MIGEWVDTLLRRLLDGGPPRPPKPSPLTGSPGGPESVRSVLEEERSKLKWAIEAGDASARRTREARERFELERRVSQELDRLIAQERRSADLPVVVESPTLLRGPEYDRLSAKLEDICQLDEKRAYANLKEILQDKHAQFRAYVLSCLAQIPLEVCMRTLCEAWEDPNPEVREVCLRGLLGIYKRPDFETGVPAAVRDKVAKIILYEKLKGDWIF